ncbi:gamma-tubulin complex component 6, partial [Paragonimus westermani]
WLACNAESCFPFMFTDRPVLLNPFQSVKSSTPPVLSCSAGTETAVIDLNLVPLRVLLDKIVLLPLTSYIQSIDRVLCDHILYNLGLMEHLNCLRQVCFLENGTFAQLLCDGLFEVATGNLATRSTIYNGSFLHDLMQSVIKTFLPSPDEVNTEDCFYRWIDDSAPLVIRTPIDLISSKTIHEESGRSGNRFSPFSFDHLTIVYHAPWPLNILIHPDVVSKYNLVFRQLIRVKFAVWVLNAAYHRLRQLNVAQLSPPASASVHQVTLWLHEMDQVVRGLEAYLGNQAVKANWSKFAARLTGTFVSSFPSPAQSLYLKQVAHLEELAEAHDSYLNEVTHCCLLDSADREIQQVVQGLLACVHWFHKVLITVQWPTCSTSTRGLERSRHAGLEQLQSAHQSFRQHARFLRLRAGRLLSARSGNQASFNLNHLITALGTNDFFAHADLQQT